MKTIVEQPFHDGEKQVQERAGVRERLEEIGPRLMRPFLTDEHRAFFPLLDFVVVGVVDDDGWPRATIVDGGGASETPTTLTLALPTTADPARARLTASAPVGVVGLQPHTRRRNRVNGVVGAVSDDRFVVDVRQTFGNCPKFIRARTTTTTQTPAQASAETAQELSAADVSLIRRADTFFIASSHHGGVDEAAVNGVDVSHRGGNAGFVDVEDDVLWVPDFQGNFYFNTLGNLVQHPRAGLVFFDGDGGLLQLKVETEILWDGSVVDGFAGAERILKLRVREVVRVKNALRLRLLEGPASPFNATTGVW